MMAHSPAVCQCNSRTPPAVSLIFTPAMDFETGSSLTVTSRDHPPSYTRLFARENGYLNVGIRLLESVLGGHVESRFWASSTGLLGPGSVLLRSAAIAGAIPATASAAEPIPRNPRRLNLSRFVDSEFESLIVIWLVFFIYIPILLSVRLGTMTWAVPRALI